MSFQRAELGNGSRKCLGIPSEKSLASCLFPCVCSGSLFVSNYFIIGTGYIDLPWCTPSILKSPFAHVFALQKGGKVPCTMKCETGPTLVYREDTIGVMSRSTGLLRQETLEPEDSPARQ